MALHQAAAEALTMVDAKLNTVGGHHQVTLPCPHKHYVQNLVIVTCKLRENICMFINNIIIIFSFFLKCYVSREKERLLRTVSYTIATTNALNSVFAQELLS